MASVSNDIYLIDYLPLGTKIKKFEPVVDVDYILKNNIQVLIETRFYSITVMEQYSGKSFEELRLEDKVLKTKDLKSSFEETTTPFSSINNQSNVSFGTGSLMFSSKPIEIDSRNQISVLKKSPELLLEETTALFSSTNSEQSRNCFYPIKSETLFQNQNYNCKALEPVLFGFNSSQNQDFIAKNFFKSALRPTTLPFPLVKNNQSTIPSHGIELTTEQNPLETTTQNQNSTAKNTLASPFKETKMSFLPTNNDQLSALLSKAGLTPNIKAFNQSSIFNNDLHFKKSLAENGNNNSIESSEKNSEESNFGYNFVLTIVEHKKTAPTINPKSAAHDITTVDTSNSNSSTNNHDHSSNKALVELNIVHDTSTEQTLDENNSGNNTQINETKESSDDEKKKSNITPQPKSNLFRQIIFSLIGGFIVNSLLFTDDLIIPSIFSTFLEIILLITTNIWMMIEDIGSRIMNQFDSSSHTVPSVFGIILSSLVIFIFCYLKNNYGGYH